MTIVPRPFLWNVEAALRELTAWKNWTPTVTQSGAVTVTVNEGKYRIVGKKVEIRATLTATAAGTANNAIRIGGLPVAFGASVAQYAVLGTMRFADTGTVNYCGVLMRYVAADELGMISDGSTDWAGVDPNIAFSNAGSADVITLEGSYPID